MTSEEKSTITSLSKCDFTHMSQYFKAQTEARKQMSKEEKQVPEGILELLMLTCQHLCVIVSLLALPMFTSFQSINFHINCRNIFSAARVAQSTVYSWTFILTQNDIDRAKVLDLA